MQDQVDSGGRPYLAFDGVDDSLATASVTWATDEVTVIAAVWKDQSTNAEDIIGFGVNPNVGDGTWALAPTSDTSTTNAGISSKGAGSNALARAGSTVAGTPWVLTGQAKISTDTCLIRRNGAGIASVSTDQGSGIYAPGVINIGRRSTGFRAFQGRLYSAFAINRLLTTQEIGWAEKWMALKSGATLA